MKAEKAINRAPHNSVCDHKMQVAGPPAQRQGLKRVLMEKINPREHIGIP